MTEKKVASDWRVRAYPIQVRIYPNINNRTLWVLYSRHREIGLTGSPALRAYTEAVNGHPGAFVELVDSRELPEAER